MVLNVLLKKNFELVKKTSLFLVKVELVLHTVDIW